MPRKRGLSCWGEALRVLAAVFIPLVAASTAAPGEPAGRPARRRPPAHAPFVTTADPCPPRGAWAESVVLVQVYRSRYDWSLPWRQEAVESSLGSGFLITGGRIVTNAHVVADARQVLVAGPTRPTRLWPGWPRWLTIATWQSSAWTTPPSPAA